MENIIIRPSDLGLKDLEIFYNPELLLCDVKEYRESSALLFKKTLITGAFVAALNCSPENVSAKQIRILDVEPQSSFVTNLISAIEDSNEHLISEVQSIIKNKKSAQFTKDEMDEMEILDAYYKEAKKYYPEKNIISF
jgi:hypothetical protein